MIDLSYDFDADLWLWPSKDAWHFITLPVEHAEEIRFFAKTRNGFGSLRVTVRIGASAWKTSIFPDSGSGSFVLPIKKEIRKAEGLAAGDRARVHLELAIEPF
jgi:hypothetical protein